MKKLFAISIPVSVCVLLSVPCSAVTLTYNIIYYQPGNGGTRIPHVGNAGGFQSLNVNGYPFPIPGYPSGSTLVPLLGGTPTLMIGGNTYNLAYASVLGGKEGGATAFPNSAGILPANVQIDIGSANINVNFVYFPVGGPGPGGKGSGAWLGEMDEMTGDLLWDYFVTVYSPQSAVTQDTTLTTTGNIYGSVDTTSAAVRINAYASTTTGGSFDRWTSEPVMPNVPTSRDLDVNSGTSTVGLAAYHTACPSGYSWSAGQYVSQCTPNSNPPYGHPNIPVLCAIEGCILKYIDKGDPAPDRFINGVIVVEGQIQGVAERDGMVAEVLVSRGSQVVFVGEAGRTVKVVETDRPMGFGNLEIGRSERGQVLTGLALDRTGRFFGTLYTKTAITRAVALRAGM